MMRLEDSQKFRNEYQFQFRRIVRIGGQLGLPILSGDGPHPGIPANVSILFLGQSICRWTPRYLCASTIFRWPILRLQLIYIGASSIFRVIRKWRDFQTWEFKIF